MITPVLLMANDKTLFSTHQEFEKEAVPHMDILYNYALRMTGNRDDADDLLQETYLKAYRFWDKYEKGTNIRAWLFRIMKNSYINRYRKETKEPDTVDYDKIQNYYSTIRDESADPNDLQEKIFGGLLEDDVAYALESLPRISGRSSSSAISKGSPMKRSQSLSPAQSAPYDHGCIAGGRCCARSCSNMRESAGT